jgi:hypothetical protein
LKALDGVRKPDFPSVPALLAMGAIEEIGDRFRRRINPDRHVLDDVRLDAGVQDLRAEADDLERRLGDMGCHSRTPSRRSAHAICQFVEGQGQIEADHALRNELVGFGERVVRVSGASGS